MRRQHKALVIIVMRADVRLLAEPRTKIVVCRRTRATNVEYAVFTSDQSILLFSLYQSTLVGRLLACARREATAKPLLPRRQ